MKFMSFMQKVFHCPAQMQSFHYFILIITLLLNHIFLKCAFCNINFSAKSGMASADWSSNYSN